MAVGSRQDFFEFCGDISCDVGEWSPSAVCTAVVRSFAWRNTCAPLLSTGHSHERWVGMDANLCSRQRAKHPRMGSRREARARLLRSAYWTLQLIDTLCGSSALFMETVCVCVCVCVSSSLSHILNGCFVYKGIYTARHGRVVDLLVKDVMSHAPPSAKICKHSHVSNTMFTLCNVEYDVFQMLQLIHDVLVVDEEDSSEVTILEVGCTFDYSLEDACRTRVLTYQLLIDVIIQHGFKCKFLVFILD